MHTPFVTSRPLLLATHDAVYSWYVQYGRTTLPWRTTSDPYAIYISEVMLQQTQVATVLARYYHPFLEQFPTLQALADAPEDVVLKAWEGLGYYRRARNLHAAARSAAPTLPSTIEGLIALKGIGKNTAHAIAAFAYHQPVAILEANVKRIMFRLYALTHATDAELWEKATHTLDTRHPFEWNQALMDIGSMLCTPKAPRCHDCPLAKMCQGKDSPESYPAKRVRTATPSRFAHIIIPWHTPSDRIFSQPRTSEFLGGLHGFLELPIPTHDAPLPASIHFQDHHHDAQHIITLGAIKQTYSHFTLHAKIHLLPITHDITLNNHPANGAWTTRNDLSALAFSRAELKALQLFLKYTP